MVHSVKIRGRGSHFSTTTRELFEGKSQNSNLYCPSNWALFWVRLPALLLRVHPLHPSPG